MILVWRCEAIAVAAYLLMISPTSAKDALAMAPQSISATARE
jgi:hypothetical protein